jgi:hypothetical protein
VADPDAQIKFDAPAILRKWPSLNNQRSTLATSYSIAEGTLDECIREFTSKPTSQHHLYESTPPRRVNRSRPFCPLSRLLN